MIRLAIALAVLPCAASAVTMQPYVPGGAPCAGACTQAWAEAAFGVETGDPVLLTVPAGSRVLLMSYARDGVPYSEQPETYLAAEEPAIGYRVDGDLWMVRIDACQNWAVVEIAAGRGVGAGASPAGDRVSRGSLGSSPRIGAMASTALASRPEVPLSSAQGGDTIVQGDTIYSMSTSTATSLVSIFEDDKSGCGCTDPDDETEQPSPVPIPGAAWMLLAGLGLIWSMKK